MRWLMAIVVSLGVANPATAGVFKGRGAKPATTTPAKKPTVEKTAADKPDAPAKKAPAKAAPAKKTQAKAPAKKGPKSTVAANGRPDDLTPEKPAKKSKAAEVTIVEDVEEDVIIRDIDD